MILSSETDLKQFQILRVTSKVCKQEVRSKITNYNDHLFSVVSPSFPVYIVCFLTYCQHLTSSIILSKVSQLGHLNDNVYHGYHVSYLILFSILHSRKFLYILLLFYREILVSRFLRLLTSIFLDL